MPFGSVQLLPGINVERTPTLLQAGYSLSDLGRFKDGLFQKLGGWQKFYPFTVAGIPRALHAWQDLNAANHLASATTSQLSVITSGSLKDITPQTKTTDFAPKFTTTIGSRTVAITDSNITNVTTLDAIFFNTPIAVGGLVLFGVYQIQSITGTHSYTIMDGSAATSAVTDGGSVPTFGTTAASSQVLVTITGHGASADDVVVFPISTSAGGVTISGAYTILSVPGANTFFISASAKASSTTTVSMNGGNAELVYYINLGPSAAGTGFGIGPYGGGGYGTGSVPASQEGAAITTTDYTLDNWGEILLACPRNSGLYSWGPNSGYQNASLVPTAPIFNGGMFVAMPQQILVCWGSSITQRLGIEQDPLLVKWSDIEDFTNFVVTSTTQAGSQRLSSGSTIKGALQGPQNALIWTDIDMWAMSYLGPPLVFGFNKVAGGAGLVSAHAAVQLNGVVYWMGRSNFYRYGGGGAQPIPCSVWDVVFQDLDTNNLDKCWAWVDTPFNEIWFFYPSLSMNTGQCTNYAKFNTLEQSWDYGTLSRSCGIAQTVLGSPIAASSQAVIYQHELTNDGDGQIINSVMQTGYFVIAEGEDVAFVDWMLPDFKWGLFNGSQSAQIQITLYSVNYPGDTPTVYGPYTVNSTSQYINPRLRGRQMAIRFESNDIGSFWRIGNVRYRWARDGSL